MSMLDFVFSGHSEGIKATVKIGIVKSISGIWKDPHVKRQSVLRHCYSTVSADLLTQCAKKGLAQQPLVT